MLLPIYKTHRGTEWGSSPFQEIHPGLSLLKRWRKADSDSAVLVFFISLHWTLDTTGLDYRLLTFHSFKWSEALTVKKKKKFQPVACRVHTLHTHYWGVYVSLIFMFTDNDGSLSKWTMLSQQCLLKLLFVLFQLRVISPNKLILMFLFTKNPSQFIISHSTVLHKT